jgi:DNA-binding transcriptional LysR family regulator
MPSALGRRIVIPALSTFHQRYPDVLLDLGLSDRPVDPVEEGVDCLIRVGPLADSSMVARRIGMLKRVTCASPGYLAKHGEPKTLEELEGHYAVNFRATHGGRPIPWIFMVDSEPLEVKMKSLITVNDADAYMTCAMEGFGMIQPTLFMALPHLLDGSLKEVLASANPKPKPISILYPHNRHLSAKVRVFADWVAELFDSMPALEDVSRTREPAAGKQGRQRRDAVTA